MIYLLVFLSGFAGLIYEILWIKRAALVFGSSSLAMSTVLAVFFLGLGLGSYIVGKLSHYAGRPLIWCACLEALLALYGVFNPLLFDWAELGFGEIYRNFELTSGTLLWLRATLVALLLLPPTLLMGGTLPLFCRQLVRDSQAIAARIGQVYGFNTLGAALGCAATGFGFLPWLGITMTTGVSALINLLTAIGFWLLSRQFGNRPLMINPARNYRRSRAGGSPVVALDSRLRGNDETREFNGRVNNAELSQLSNLEKSDEVNKPAEIGKLFYLVLGLLFFMIGSVALANELIWTRFLTNFIRNSVYTYTVTLFVVLLGTVFGSFWAARRFDRCHDRRALLVQFAAMQAIAATFNLVLMHLPVLFWLYLKLYGVLPYMVLMLPPAMIAGASFPLINRIVINEPQQASRHVGQMTAINILGCIVGSLATGYLLLPQWGLDTSIYVACSVGLLVSVLALVVAFISDRQIQGDGIAQVQTKSRLKRFGFAPGLVAGGCLVGLLLPLLGSVKLPNDYIAPPEQLVAFTEGYNSTLAVIRRGAAKIMLVSQLWQGTSAKNHQIMAAHIPMMHNPAAKNVLVIGLGVGQTASRFLMYPVAHLDIVDIEPRIFKFTRDHFNSEWMHDPRVNLIAEDGRNYVNHSHARYDLISVEVGQLFRPGVDVFYTREFYRQSRLRLTDDGMLVQFVPIEFLREIEFASILKTFMSEYPQASLWYNGNELLLIGFKGKKFKPDKQGFERILTDETIREDLRYSQWGGPPYWLNQFANFIGAYLAGEESLRKLADLQGSTIYSDDKPTLAYSIADFDESDLRAAQLAPLIHQHLSPLGNIVAAGDSASNILQEAEIVRQNNIGDMLVANQLELIDQPDIDANPEAAVVRLKELIQYNRQNMMVLRMLGETLVRLNRDAEAITYLRSLLDQNDQDLLANQKMGLALVKRRQLSEAIPYLQKALAINPNLAETANTLAVALINMGRVAEAVQYFRRAAELEPQNQAAQRNLENAERMLGQSNISSP